MGWVFGMARLRCGLLWALPGLLLLLAARPAPGTANSSWTLATEHMALTFGSDGMVASVVDKATGRDYALPHQPLVSVIFTNTTGAAAPPQSVQYSEADGLLTATFANGAVIPVSVEVAGEMIVFTVLAKGASGLSRVSVVMLNAPLKIASAAGEPVVAHDQTFAVLVLPGDFRTFTAALRPGGSPAKQGAALTGCNASAGVVLQARTESIVRLTGQRAALWGGPWSGVDAAIAKGEKHFGLPSPQIDGVWAKRAPDVHKGYFLITVTPDTLNQTIEYAAQSGMKYITFLDNIWSGDGGHYNYVSTATIACHLLPTRR